MSRRISDRPLFDQQIALGVFLSIGIIVLQVATLVKLFFFP